MLQRASNLAPKRACMASLPAHLFTALLGLMVASLTSTSPPPPTLLPRPAVLADSPHRLPPGPGRHVSGPPFGWRRPRPGSRRASGTHLRCRRRPLPAAAPSPLIPPFQNPAPSTNRARAGWLKEKPSRHGPSPDRPAARRGAPPPPRYPRAAAPPPRRPGAVHTPTAHAENRTRTLALPIPFVRPLPPAPCIFFLSSSRTLSYPLTAPLRLGTPPLHINLFALGERVALAAHATQQMINSRLCLPSSPAQPASRQPLQYIPTFLL